jgi:PAS domain S-box-containing protein
MDRQSKANKNEDQLFQGNDFLNAVLESLNHPFYVIDASDYTIKLANSAARFGPLQDSSTCYRLTHNRDTPCEDKEHPCVLKEIKKSKKPVIEEHIHFDQSGDPRIIEVHGYPLFDSKGNVARIIEYNLDITDRKRAEDSLRDAHQLLETIFEHTHVSIACLDPQFNFIRVNKTYAASDGREPSFFPGKNHFRLYPNKKNEELFRMVVKTGEPHCEFSKSFVYADYPERGVSYWDWNLVPIKDVKGKVSTLILTLQDVTERREAEKKIEESLREKELLLKEVHHRVKNNLAVIHSLLQLQSRHIKDNRYKEMLDDSMARIKTMGLIHERLYRSDDLAKINFSDYIEDMIDSMYASYGISSRKVLLKKEIERMTLGLESAVPCGLIVNELLSNCMKHAFPGGREGIINVILRVKDKSHIELIVRDSGVGIPEDLDLEHRDSLGMTLIYSLAGQIQGDIELNREKGVEFKITFPM